MKKLILKLLFIFMAFILAPPSPLTAASSELLWMPDKTVVFIVGVLGWKHNEIYSSYPVKNRRDELLVDYFKNIGVPDEKIIYLKDKEAFQKNIDGLFLKALSLCDKDSTFFLYYCGHGSMNDAENVYFASYDAGDNGVDGWDVSSIISKICDGFKGSRVFLAADCCHSGFLCAAAGRSSKKELFACMASSLASQQSTGNWTFTEKLLEAMKGMAYIDGNGDGRITLGEIALSVKEDMAFAEEQLSASYFGEMIGADTIVSRTNGKKIFDVEKRVEAYRVDGWYKARVVDASKRRLKLHYFGWDYSDDEWVSRDKIREVQKKSYPLNSRVSVEWKGKWYCAKVLKVENGIHLIHYDDYGDEWDEWVGASSIKSIR